jgi:hypothetical protein
MGRRKSSPKFISAWVWTGDGQVQEFADIHFGTGQGRQWETEMNFGQPAGRPGLAQAMGRRKSSPTFISARVWTGDGRPK